MMELPLRVSRLNSAHVTVSDRHPDNCCEDGGEDHGIDRDTWFFL
jgi:hypothetical protein